MFLKQGLIKEKFHTVYSMKHKANPTQLYTDTQIDRYIHNS